MKILIYSDVHGNLPAFEKMIKAEKDCEQFICLGDLVNYAPWSNACVDLALSLPNAVLIMGNHEEAFLNHKYNGSNELVKHISCQRDIMNVAHFHQCIDIGFVRVRGERVAKKDHGAYFALGDQCPDL